MHFFIQVIEDLPKQSMLLKIDNVIASKSITSAESSPSVDSIIVMIASRIHYSNSLVPYSFSLKWLESYSTEEA